MKNFIITAGALLLILVIMQYQFQLNDLLRQKQNLKYAADEAAASAGLCYDEESFGEGRLRFDRKKAENKAGEMIALNLPEEMDSIKWEIDFTGEGSKRPQVVITIRTENLSVTSEYEHVPYGRSIAAY